MPAGNWKRRLRLLVPGVVVVVAVLVWLLHPRTSDRQLIVELVRRGEHGIETKDVREIMSCVAPDYRDAEHTSRADLYKMVLQWARLEAQGEVTVEDYDLEVDGDRATGQFDVVFVLSDQGQRQALPFHLTMTFEKQRQRWCRVWLVTSVEGYQEGTLIEGVTDAE